jgi:DHA1 family L-arabinose/isopropyl-beta-D-thiogalactopyranoside export protein-like MFS transporter/DHA1 family inner membrane transport protein
MAAQSLRLAGGRRATAVLAALSVATFTYLTTELLPVGLLTLMADDLDRSPSSIGLLVTGYAVVVVLASLPLTRLTQRVPRRHLLGAALGVFTVATVVTAVARSYEMLLAARLVTALTQAVFWAVVGATATGLFPPHVRGRAMSRLSIGTSLGPVLGVPIGTWLGQQAGWRTAFLALAVVNLFTWLAVVTVVPTYAPEDGGAARGTDPDVRKYALVVAGTLLAVTGGMTAYTYVTPFLLDVARFAESALSPLLMAAGVAGVVGAFAIGVILDRRPRAGLIAPVAVLAAAMAGLYALGTLRAATVALLCAFGAAYSAMATAVGHRTLQVAPGNTDMASAGTGIAFNIGIAAGSLLGGVLIDEVSVRSVAVVGAVFTGLAVAVIASEPWLVRPRGRPLWATRRRQGV